MTTLDELVAAPPAADRGVPAGFEFGDGWRHVVEIADPALGAAVAWHDLTAIDGLFTGYDYTRGAAGYQDRYRASVANLDLYCSSDAIAPWNPDTSATFGIHVDLGPGLLIRSGFAQVVGGVVSHWNPRFCCKVESWDDSAYSQGRVRLHRVTARDTMSSLVGVPLPARTAENWFERFVHLVADSGWPYGWVVYGARHLPGPLPVLELPDRPASSSAINELDAILDPVGLVWYTNRLGQLVVRPKVNDTFHAAAFTAGADGTPWVEPDPVDFAWWAGGEPPGPYTGRNHAAYAIDTPGIESFGFDETDRWVINHVRVTDPAGAFDDDDPVSIQRFDRKSLQASWLAPNDTVAADLLTLRANATVEARPVHTNIRLKNFWPGPANLEFCDDVDIVHRNTDEGLEVFGSGWLRSYTEQVRPLGCDTDWSIAFVVDIHTTSARNTTLLPVEDLTLVGLYDTAASFTWTNPAQAITPTHTQIRLINPASLWQTVEYPLDGLTWEGLDAATAYEFQVRLLRIVDGLTTHFSPIRAVSFTTLEAITPDDDGNLPPPDEGCDVGWELQQSTDHTTWTTIMSGVVTEPPYRVEIGGDLPAGYWYRIQSRELCDGVPPGPWVPGETFPGDCMGGERLDTPPFDNPNLVAYWPEVCPQAIHEVLSGEPMIRGHALKGHDVIGGQIPVLVGGPGMIGHQTIESPLGSHDLSIGCRIMIGAQPTRETVVFEYGGAMISIVAATAGPDPDAAGFSVNGNVRRGGGVINTIEGTTIYGRNTVYDICLTHDPGSGELILYVDGEIEAAAALSFGDRATAGRMEANLPASSWITDLAAWDVILTFTTMSPYDEAVLAMGAIWYVRPGAVTTAAGSPLGGTITTPGDGYRYHRFTATGTDQFWTMGPGSFTVEAFVVGGGASGGRVGTGVRGGGGGGGQCVYSTSVTILTGAVDVTVGSGGAVPASGQQGLDGFTSRVGSFVTAAGGSGGGAVLVLSGVGRSGTGGGGGGAAPNTATTTSGGAGVGAGNGGGGGGATTASQQRAGGGGGGTGNATTGVANGATGAGGAGYEWPPGSGTRYGGGGGGGTGSGTAAGGSGGGGAGGTAAGGAGTNGTGGGGGGGSAGNLPGVGGSGIVIIRYLWP